MKIHHKIGAAIIKNKKLLMCRKKGEPHFILPGGRPAAGETAEQALARELEEELGVKLVSSKFHKTYEAAHFKDKDTLVRMDVYFADFEGEPKAQSEIAEFKWVDSKYKENRIKVASIHVDFFIPELKRLKLIA
ncbi:MAG: NUDIX domain-containing protein [DPANN group archaeon]|nr:NUDIX domain-containing protein [DPANN group archaeon]